MPSVELVPIADRQAMKCPQPTLLKDSPRTNSPRIPVLPFVYVNCKSTQRSRSYTQKKCEELNCKVLGQEQIVPYSGYPKK